MKIDVTKALVLGRNLPKIVPPRARKLNAKVPRIWDEYIKLLERSLEQHGVYKRLVKLAAAGDFPIACEAKQALKKLDQLVIRLMLDAEDKCRKLYACHHKFSPDVKSYLDR